MNIRFDRGDDLQGIGDRQGVRASSVIVIAAWILLSPLILFMLGTLVQIPENLFNPSRWADLEGGYFLLVAAFSGSLIFSVGALRARSPRTRLILSILSVLALLGFCWPLISLFIAVFSGRVK